MPRQLKRLAMIGLSIGYVLVRGMRRLINRFRGLAVISDVVVLTYHAVRDSDVARFERQMQYVKAHTTSVFADVPARAGDRRVAVTFDDAFQDVFDCALPVLARLGIPATIFVPTGSLGRLPAWMSANSGHDVGPVVSADRLRSIDTRRVRIGSHTVTHPRLSQLDPSALEAELADSKRELEALTALSIDMISLPFGSSAPHVVAAAQQTGYSRVFANVPVDQTAVNSGLVGRINVSLADWPIEFRLKVRGAYDWMAIAVPAKRAVFRVLRRSGATS